MVNVDAKTVDKFVGHREICGGLWRALLAEYLGTLFLVLIGCGSTIKWVTKLNPDADLVQIALAFGVTVAVIVQCICHVSGGHINPAVSIGMFVTGNISLIRFITYVISQSVGAITGSGILRGLTPKTMLTNGTLGATIPYKNMSDGQAFGVEMLITFVLVFTVFSVCDSNRTDIKGSGPLMIGLSVTICHLFAIPYTGSSMNPARSFGPAVVMNLWERQWVYWVGPGVGGIIAGIVYTILFRAKAPKSDENVKIDDLPEV